MGNLRRQFDKSNEQEATLRLMAHDFLDIMNHIRYSSIETSNTETILIPMEGLTDYEKNRLADNYGFYASEAGESIGF